MSLRKNSSFRIYLGQAGARPKEMLWKITLFGLIRKTLTSLLCKWQELKKLKSRKVESITIRIIEKTMPTMGKQSISLNLSPKP